MKINGNRQGFSMIEVLVATSILVVLVMMLALLFQQSSVVWRTGLLRAKGYTQLRAYVGAIQRDASAAIDAKNLPEKLKNGKEQNFASDTLVFYTLTGGESTRSLSRITWTSAGKRTKEVLNTNGTEVKWDPDKSTTILDDSEENRVIDPLGFSFPPNSNSSELPLYIKVDAAIVQKGTLYQVGAASAGPDMQWDTKDDICTWVKKK